MNSNKNDKKLSKKDLIIILLSVVSLAFLVLIIYMSNKRDAMVSEYLEKDKDITTDDVVLTLNGGAEVYMDITEISGDKWIELHNNGAETIDLSGMTVYVGDEKAATVEEGVELEKNSYLAVELSVNPGAAESNVVSIKSPEDKFIKTMLIPKLSASQSYGIADEKTNTWGYITPSKEASNEGTEVEYVKYDGIALSAPGGFYSEAFNLILSADDGEVIYYTIDGSDPNTESTLYDGAIKIFNRSGSGYEYLEAAMGYSRGKNYFPSSIDTGIVVKAIAVDASGNVTKEINQAYFIGLARDSDYVNLPVLEITTDPYNLYDYENGIFIAGKTYEDALIQGIGAGKANYRNSWGKNARIEYYESDKGKSFEADVQLMVRPDAQADNKQKNLVLEMDGSDYTSYEGASILDYISSDGRLNVYQYKDDNNLKIRNAIISSLAANTDVGMMQVEPCSVFIDGVYWGVYAIQAPYNAKLIEDRYNVSASDVTIHEDNVYNSSFNRFYEYVTTTDMSIDTNYENLKTMLDVDNYIQYICLNLYVGNSSFYPERGTCWRTISTGGKGYADGKWRFLCSDMVDTLNRTGLQTPTINTCLQNGIQGDRMLQSLLMNKDFCQQLTKTMDNMAAEVFTEDNYTTSIDKYSELMKKPALASYKRFYGVMSDSAFNTGVANIKAFFAKRADWITRYTREMAEQGGNLAKARELAQEMGEEGTVLEEASEAEDIEDLVEPDQNEEVENGGENNNG
ncbi:CotH kinase family protein [Butyrivibrio sp. VCB2006]|uniref:CotH kinase family protein n=1 Tax=Butyrivibrio sp. VCB2006 TaxID=1280679 RepID=UPI0003F5BA43|nr:CotH kinase family protein [Butyrivibrio sp. VCB2006]